jgi:GNAT superfamily N-acetyltransferase
MMTENLADILVRHGRLEDATACARIKNDWIDETPWMPRIHSAVDVESYYRDVVFAKRHVVVAEHRGLLAGFAACDLQNNEVTSLFVHRGARGHGIGKRLITYAKEQSAGQLELWTFVQNEGARRFYLREGFTEVRTTPGDNEEQLPDILLGWRST